MCRMNTNITKQTHSWSISVAVIYPAAVRFLHLEHVAPRLNAGGLALTAPPPGEARQRLVVPPQPRVRALRQTEHQLGSERCPVSTQ